jgi:aspartyl-tRNA(Asn)/glutamyl-tRNA(Gln) amidotransferase subunit A
MSEPTAAILSMSAREIASAVRRGELLAEAVTDYFLARISRFNPQLNAFIACDADEARKAARAVDQKRARGEALGALAGVPVGIKDNLCVRGQPTRCASKILADYRPPYDAHVVERLRAEDAIPLGRCNMDEFAMGSSNENSAFGPVKNPWDVQRAPGGSSGGSAAACAAGLVPLALGSDTGGSVRQPAAFCGVSAIKPTYGRVSRYGLVAFASSLDQVGPFGRDTTDAALLLSVIAGHDGRDATSVDRPVDPFVADLSSDLRGVRVGVVRDLDRGGNSESVNRAFDASLERLRELGASLVDVELPHAKYAVATYYLIATAEASSNLARFDGMRYGLRASAPDLTSTYGATRTQGFGAEVQRRIMLGTYALSAGYYEAFYLKAQKLRTLIAADYQAAFSRCDVLVTPTAPTPAFTLGEKVKDPLAMYLADIYTLPPSLAGIPALSAPVGFSEEGLPIGLQLCAPMFAELRLCRVAAALAARSGSVGKLPPSFAS